MEYKWTALTVTTVGTLMAGIDDRIVTIGLPTVAQQLQAGPAEIIWVTQAYVLAGTVGLLLIGRMADVFGRVKLYIFGFVIFTLGSALSSLSLNPYQLIAFRALQGIGAGTILSSGAAIVTDASPHNQLGMMLGINQSATRIGNTLGLTLSGVILSVVDWRGLFYVNVPIGIFATVWGYLRLREISKKDLEGGMDWQGFLLFSVGLTLVLVAITFLSYGSVGLEEGYASLVSGSLLLVLFVKVESRSLYPMLDLRLFKVRRFAAGSLTQLIYALAWSGILVLMAFYLQIGLGYSPLQAGLGILPLDISFFAATLGGGRLADKYGSRGTATLGLVISAFSFGMMSTFGASTPYLEIAGVVLLTGVGNGMFNSSNASAIMSSVPGNRRGVAAAFRSTMYNVGSNVSYGLVILLVTLGIPYGPFSQLLQGTTTTTLVTLALRAEFLHGFSFAALVLAVTMAIGIVPSALRGGGSHH